MVFDTFLDRRHGVAVYTNPLGALGDFQITNEGNPNRDWNPVAAALLIIGCCGISGIRATLALPGGV